MQRLDQVFPASPLAPASPVATTSLGGQAAGTRGHLIYAYRKTGMIMGAENAGLWTEEEIDEWNAEMAEYEALHGPIGEEK
jgi:hypothetical protein